MNTTQNSSSRKIKAVFFDLDGTLISFNTRSVPESAQLALQKLKEKGVKIIAATGRGIGMLGHVRYLDFDGFITFNGGYCVSKAGDLLHRETIHIADIEQLIGYRGDKDVNFVLMTHDSVRVKELTQDIVLVHEHLKLPVPPLFNAEKDDISAILQANVFIAPEDEPVFMHTVMPNCTASRWTPKFMDVNPKDISKQVGIDAMCRYFSIDVSETMALGDGGNDITMLKHAGIGVAMGNAMEEVKLIADYITDDTDNNGIWNALVKFGVIESV